MDINNQGQIVGAFGGDFGSYGFLYSGGTFTTIDVPLTDSNSTVASGINERGQIVGSYSVNTVGVGGVGYGFLYDAGNFTSLQVPGALQTSATGINSSGQIIGQYSVFNSTYQSGQQFGFLYADGLFTTIADPDIGVPTGGTQPMGINNFGQLSAASTMEYHAVGSFTPQEFSPLSAYPEAMKPKPWLSTTQGT